MPSEDFGDRFERHERMLEGLARLWQRQGEINDRLDASLAELKAFNRQQVELNATLTTGLGRLEVRLDRIATLLERSLGGSSNGRDA
jgi:hypothetical protein